MNSTTFGWVMWGTAGVLSLAAVILFVWSMLWDRFRAGRRSRRCSRCWYSMDGVAGLRCPECGVEAKNERRLHRSRRRWRWGAVAVMLGMAAVAAGVTPRVRERGWRQSIPGAVLVTVWPVSVKEWVALTLNGDFIEDAMLEELRVRFRDGRLEDWEGNWWRRRVERELRRQNRLRTEDIDPTLNTLRNVRVKCSFDNQPMHVILSTLSKEIGIPISVDWTQINRDSTFSLDLVGLNGCEALDWIMASAYARRHGYGEGWSVRSGEIVIGKLNALPRRCESYSFADAIDRWCEIDRLMNETASSEGYSNSPMSVTFPRIDPRNDFRTMMDIYITTLVDPECWLQGGGETGTTHPFGDWIMVQVTPQHLPLIGDHVELLRRSLDNSSQAMQAYSLDEADWAASCELIKKLQTTTLHPPDKPLMPADILQLVKSAAGVEVSFDVDLREWSEPLNLSGTGGSSTTAAHVLDMLVSHLNTSSRRGRPTHSRRWEFNVAWGTYRGTVWLVSVYPWHRVSHTRIYVVEDLLDEFGWGIDDLRSRITMEVDPDGWVEAGGAAGNIQEFVYRFVIQNTTQNHLQIEELLAKLRVEHASRTKAGGTP